MKKYLKLIIVAIFSCMIIYINYPCLADDETTTIDTNIMSEQFLKDLDPNDVSGTSKNLSDPFVKTIQQVVNPALGFVQAIGGILTVVSVAMYGFGMLLVTNEKLAGDLGINLKGGAKGKVDLINFGRTLLIGSVLLFSSATIVKFVFKIFTV